MACESVLGLEVVTADGEQIYCDPEHHPDLYWAARGAGPGFFGVVTSFKLRIHRRPAVVGTCLYMYPIEVADEVYTWGRDISPEVDPRVELQILATLANPAAGIDHPTITIASPVFAESEEEAAKALALLGTCPVADQAMVNLPYMPTTLAELVHRRDDQLPRGAPLHRRQHVHVGFGRRTAAGHPQDHRNDATAPLALHLHGLERVTRSRRTRSTAWRTRSTWRCTPSGRIRPTTNGTATGQGPTWRRCRTWRPVSRSPTRISAGARRDSSPTRIWRV